MSRFDFEPFDPDRGDDWLDAGQTINEGDLDGFIDLECEDLAPFADWSRPRWRNRQKHDPTRASRDVMALNRVWWTRSRDDEETVGQRLMKMFADDPDTALVIEDIEAEAGAIKNGMYHDHMKWRASR